MHDLCAPLNELLKNTNPGIGQQNARSHLKNEENTDVRLISHKPNSEIIVASDASLYGVEGMHSLQNDCWDIKTNSSYMVSLTTCWKKIIRKLKKGSWDYICSLKVPPLYLWFWHFILQTDHKPLLTIFGLKERSSYAHSQQTAKMGYKPVKLQLQNGVPTIEKIQPCKQIVKTNSQVSRNTRRYSGRFPSIWRRIQKLLCNTVRELPVTLEQIKQEVLRDEYVNQIKAIIFEKDQQTTNVFSICDEVLPYRECVVILSTLQKHILKDFHTGHPGSTRMKSLNCSYVHWPNMDKDIENTVKSCNGCVPWQPRYLLLNSIPDQKWIYHGLEFTLTSLGLLKDITHCSRQFLKVARSTQLQKPNYRNYYKNFFVLKQ